MSTRLVKYSSYYLFSAIILIVGGVGLWNQIERTSFVNDPSYEHGLQVLKKLNQLSVDEVMIMIDESQNDKSGTVALKDSLDTDFKAYFRQSVFVGDSLVEAFLVYDYLESSSVIAKVGARLATSEQEVERMSQLNPKSIFLAYGINDLLVYETAAPFIERYKELILAIQRQLPQAKIYITSIFPVQEEVTLTRPELSNDRIESFNEQLQVMCEDLDLNYLNIGQFVTDNVYEPDGIHVMSQFYPTWMAAVKTLIEGDEEVEY